MIKRHSLAVLASLVALLALSGCMRMHQNFELHSDDTVSGTIIMAYDLASAEAQGMTREDLVSGLDTDGLTAGQEGSVTAAEYDQDGYVGYELTFNHTELGQLGSDTGVVIQREGDEFLFSADLGGSTDTSMLDQASLDRLDVKISVAFPGPVLSQEGGVISGNTVHWDVDFSGEVVISARGSAVEGGSEANTLTIVLVGVGLIVVLGALLLVVRSRRAGGTGAAGAAGAGAAPLVEGPAGDGYE